MIKYVKDERNKVNLIDTIRENESFISSTPKAAHHLMVNIIDDNDFEALDLFIELGFDINDRDEWLNTVAHKIYYCSIEMLTKLIEHGLNIHSINIEGESPLFKLVKGDENHPVQELLIEKGANPYNTDFRGYSSFDYVSVGTVGEQRLSRNSCEGKDPYFNELISQGLYDLALNAIYLQINQLGGLGEVMKRSYNYNLYQIIRKLQYAYMYNGMIKEASAIFQILINDTRLITYDHFNNQPLSFVPTLIQGDLDTVFKFIEESYELNKYAERKATYFVTLGYMLTKRFGNEVEFSQFEKLLKRQYSENNYYTRLIANLLKAKSELEEEQVLAVINSNNSLYNKITQSELNFLHSFYFIMNKDAINSEMLYRDIVQLSLENEGAHFSECAPSLLMIKALEENLLS